MLNIDQNTVLKRAATDMISSHLDPGKVVVLYGPRRVGKTTILKQIAAGYKKTETVRFVTGEDTSIHHSLSSRQTEVLSQFSSDATLLIIDEAHLVPDIGRNLKLLIDSHPQLKIIASGSASFDLARQVGEPLVGRKWTIMLYPFWMQELADHIDDWFNADQALATLILYGSYPEVIQTQGYTRKQELLHEIVNSYLYKDVLAIESVRKPKVIRDLLELLAWQIGNEVSLNELANTLQIDRATVARYLDLLEQAFVIVNIRGFSRNLRKEITKMSRYYFYDTGLRNALINNFTELKFRPDLGALWENWLVMERIKKQAYTGLFANNFFWRTYDKKEIDWVEERDGKLFGYEFKYSKTAKARGAKTFLSTYKNAQVEIIHPDNYRAFIGRRS